MNPPTTSFWLELAGLLAAQITILIVAAWAIQSRLPWPRWRRAIWMASLAGVAVLVATVLTGADRRVFALLPHDSRESARFVVRGNLLPAGDAEHVTREAVAGTRSTGLPEDPAAETESLTGVWWPLWVWLAGAIAVGFRVILPRFWLASVRWSSSAGESDSADLPQRLGKLSEGLGCLRRVRMVSSSRLAGPIAFGVLRPAIGLPADFSRHSRVEQDVMLAHELAHLAGRDPLLLAIADAILALLWWHPLVWWARRQFRAASESVADEASLFVENGPAVLAGCLVDLAARWSDANRFGVPGMAGFRSELGRRVERLLGLERSERMPRLRWGGRLAVGCAGTVSLAGAMAFPFWMLPAHAELREPLLAVLGSAIAQVASPTVEISGATSVEPPRTPPADLATVSSSKRRPIDELLGDARLLYETGNLPEAKAKLQAILERAPESEAARYYLNLVRESEIEKVRRETRAQADPPARDTNVRLPAPPSAEARPEAASETPPSPPAETLHTRIFRVETDLFRRVQARTDENATAPPRAFESLRQALLAAGLDFGSAGQEDDPPGTGLPPARGAAGRTLFFKEQTGVLLVRATEAELATVEQVLDVLNSTPPQVLLEAKFVEVTGDDPQPLGFDWFVGQQPMGGDTVSAAGANPPATLTGILNDAQFRNVVRTFQQAGTNVVRDVRGDQIDWPGRGATHAGNIRVTAALGTSISGILTDSQFRTVLNSLEQRPGVDVLSAPRVTTLSGRQAQIQIVETRSVITGIKPEALQKPGLLAAADPSPLLTTQVPVGPTLDILPTVSADGDSIQLTLIPSVTEFLGYDEPPKGGKVRVWENGKSRLVELPLPRFRVRQMQTQSHVSNGHTVMLGGLTIEDTVQTKDKVPVLGDVPLLGRMFRRQSKQTVRKRLLVFVTPTIIDAAGNPVRSASNRPSAPGLGSAASDR